MPSVQRFLSGHNNLARAAVLAASSVAASTAVERTGATRAGSGRVRLGGSYTGHEATAVDVEIVNAGTGTPRASAPQFVGVGNGTLEVQAVSGGATLQTYTLTLTDLGIATTAAGLDVREVRLVAKTAGAAGNQIRISVTPQLTRSATAWSLLADWNTGQATQRGAQWDFGALPLAPKGELDSASPRIAFGFDPQVYRPWRQLKDGEWEFGLSPALQRNVPAGTPVLAVTGGYVVKVTDGVSTETYGAAPAAAIVTFHDLLKALAGSALVAVAGVVVADRTAGGQAAIDVPLRTSAWLLALGGAIKLGAVRVPAAAPTQAVTVECINADTVGAERWQVAGDVSGPMGAAVTGVPFAHAAIEFTVPVADATAVPQGDWSFKWSPVARDDGEVVPDVCLKPFRLGANARPLAVTFRYTQRPPDECSCAGAAPLPLSAKCLGITTTGGSAGMALDVEYQTRLQALYEWRAEFIKSNVALQSEPELGVSIIRADVREIEIVNLAATELAECLSEIFEDADARSQWDIELASVVAMMLPYMQLDASGARVGRMAMVWSPDTQVQYGQYIAPTRRNGHLYRARASGQTGASEPTWGPSVTDGDVNYDEIEYWSATSAVAGDAVVDPGVGVMYVADGAGTTGADEPIWNDDEIIDGTVTWKRMTAAGGEIHLSSDVSIQSFYVFGGERSTRLLVLRRGGYALLLVDGSIGGGTIAGYRNFDFEGAYRHMESPEDVAQMVRARMDYCRTLAGIVPKSDASAGAGQCWQDHGDAYWWVDTEGRYLPAFTNRPYISARRDRETGRPYSTMEFGFGLVAACEGALKEGDQITIRVDRVDGARQYGVGDKATLQTVGAAPAWLAGGVDGTDALTWAVAGSVDGALTDYAVPTDGAAASSYSHAGAQFALALGGIPFALGDRFTFAVEAGQYRWRRDAGTWSSPADIPATGPAALADGLELAFDAGAAPSFVDGDAYAFAVHQPHAASHVQDATESAWAWDGAAATLDYDLGQVQRIGAVALARYALPAGASVQAELSADGTSWTALLLNVSGPVAVKLTDTQARYVRISVSSAAGGRIGWVWAGKPLATDHHASTCRRTRRWAMRRGDGAVNPAALYAGRGDAWHLEWSLDQRNASRLLETDVDALVAMIDYAQQRDEPLILVPHHLHPEDAALVRMGADALEVSDLHDFQPDKTGARMLSATLVLDPVFA